MEKEYFIVANSFAAPFFSDTSEHFVKAESPQEALMTFKDTYKHPCGLYAAVCYDDANAYHKNKKPLAKWLCNQEIEKMKLTEGKGCYSFLGHGDGVIEIDGAKHTVKDYKDGAIV